MDWMLFWSAFGAIGTTLATLTTAITIITAVKQYQQPLKKDIRVRYGGAFIDIIGKPNDNMIISIRGIHVTFGNYGVRDAEIVSVYFCTCNRKYQIHNAQIAQAPSVAFPDRLRAEEKMSLYFDEDFVRFFMQDNLRTAGNVVVAQFMVEDSLGNYYYSQKIKWHRNKPLIDVLSRKRMDLQVLEVIYNDNALDRVMQKDITYETRYIYEKPEPSRIIIS